MGVLFCRWQGPARGLWPAPYQNGRHKLFCNAAAVYCVVFCAHLPFKRHDDAGRPGHGTGGCCAGRVEPHACLGKPAGNAPKLCFGLYCFLWGRIWLARFFAAPAAKTVRPAGRHSGAGRCVGPVAFAHQYLLLQPGHLGAQRAQPGVPVHLLQRFLRVCLCQDKEHLGAGDDSLFQQQRGAVVRQCRFHQQPGAGLAQYSA